MHRFKEFRVTFTIRSLAKAMVAFGMRLDAERASARFRVTLRFTVSLAMA